MLARLALVLVCAGAALASACGTKKSDDPATATPRPNAPAAPRTDHAGRPPSVTDRVVEVANRYRDYMAALATDFVAAGSDCKQGIAVIRAHTAAAKALKTDGEDVMAKLRSDGAAQAWFEETYAGDIMAAAGKMRPIVEACLRTPTSRPRSRPARSCRYAARAAPARPSAIASGSGAGACAPWRSTSAAHRYRHV